MEDNTIIFPHFEVYQEDLKRIEKFVTSSDFVCYLTDNTEEIKDALLIVQLVLDKINELSTKEK